MPDKCGKHDDTMDRIFNKINDAEKRLESIDTKIESIVQFKDMIHKIMFGNGKEGIITKVGRCLSQMKLQWSLLILIAGSIIGSSIGHFIVK